MKKVVIAPDSFKGTLSATQVCDILSEVISKNYPGTQVEKIPVADGGEGTADTICSCLGGEKIYCNVKSPLGRDIRAHYVMLRDKTAVIESALASGIILEEKNDPLLASSYGTGQMMKYALDGGAKRLFVAIGGSAMTDAGTGCLNALGVKFYGCDGGELYPCGKALENIARIDASGLDERLGSTEITVLCDVKNTLYGKNGAAWVYARQKGADDNAIELLDRGLEHFAKISAALLSEDYSSYEGAGAAGGLGFALVAFMGAELKRGIDTVLELCSFDERVRDADLVITGEGKLDSQSLMGKVPFGVATRSQGKRIIALVGINEASKEQGALMGIGEVIEANPLHLPFDDIKRQAKELLYAAAEKIIL